MMKAGQPKRFCLGPTLSSAGLNPYRLTALPPYRPPLRTTSCALRPAHSELYLRPELHHTIRRQVEEGGGRLGVA